MKKIYLLFTAIYLSLSAVGQAVQPIPLPKVDQRVELVSIVFRLAGSEEYNRNDNVNYVRDIHQHFDKFAGHPLIQFAKELRDSNSVGYDAVVAMAVHLKDAPNFDPIVPFSAELPDRRWSVPTATKFVKLLKQFYKDADCKAFFQSETANYTIAERKFYTLFQELDVNWYTKFYGKVPNESFNIIIGLGNGGTNYGPHLDLPGGIKKVYAIIGSGTFDSTGTPLYSSKNYLPTLIHEFNHSFINYLTDNYEKQLKEPGQLIFEKENVAMRRQAYTDWKTVMSEALVRAAVIEYLKSHDPDTTAADKELKLQLARGFVWMRPLVNLLGEYEKQRTTYPTLERFMPEIIRFYEQVAPKIDFYDQDYSNHCARVIAVQPFKNNDTTVSPNLTEIKFDFDKKLDGIRYFIGAGKKGMDHYPKPQGFSFTNDKKAIIMKVQLKANTEYQVNITGRLMRTDDGYAVENYLLNFKTGDK